MTADIFRLPLLVIVGPTAVGKTELCLEIAGRLNAEIVSVDSMQVFRHMDIGTAKPGQEEMARIPHHLIDVADPDEDYDAARFAAEAEAAIREIHGRGRLPLLTGGTGLYLEALLRGLLPAPAIDPELRRALRQDLEEQGHAALHARLGRLDPESAARIHVRDGQRLLRALELSLSAGRPWSELLREHARRRPACRFACCLRIGLAADREQLYRRIDERTALMLDQGLPEEVESLLAMGYAEDLKPMRAIGYRHCVNLVRGRWDRDTTLNLMARDTRRYAKRQLTWFGRGKEIRWFDREDRGGVLEAVAAWMDHGAPAG